MQKGMENHCLCVLEQEKGVRPPVGEEGLATKCCLENLSTALGGKAQGAGTDADRWGGVGVTTCGISFLINYIFLTRSNTIPPPHPPRVRIRDRLLVREGQRVTMESMGA